MMRFPTRKNRALPDDFDPKAYLELNPDVEAAKVDPAVHYLKFGVKEGRQYRRPEGKKEFTKFLAHFSDLAPDDQNGFDLFEGVWSSKIPNIANTGIFDGFNDPRVHWLLEELGDLTGASVLELGPLEGGHTHMLETAGAQVTAIEANHGAFLRCLLVKNALGMKSKFVLGDFQSADFQPGHRDLVVASGVLYHMTDPVGLLSRLSETADKLFLWTHYFDEDLSKWAPDIRSLLKKGKWDTKNVIRQNVSGLDVRMVRQSYGDALGWDGFCGGSDVTSLWIYKDDLVALLGKLGYTDVRINFDMPDHPNGPSFAVLAQK